MTDDEFKGKTYTVGQINAYIKNMFAQDFVLRHLAVSGEISNCKYHSSGHVFFTLKDDTGILKAVLFAGSRKKGLSFDMKDGDKVIVTGSIRVYERDGAYQLYAEQIFLQGTGLLYQKYEELKNMLAEMGMFSEEYKQEIPAYSFRVGVVTSPTGSVIRDIRNVAHRRNPFVQILLCPAQVQGDGAAESISAGIRTLEQHGVDVIIIGRGGGSIEDLWAFNEEIVARAIFECGVPVISAVGHDPNTTIADLVADKVAPTPSAAAELAVFDLNQTIQKIESDKLALNRGIGNRLEQTEERIGRFRAELAARSPENLLLQERHRAADDHIRLQNRMEEVLREARHRLELAAASLDERSPLKKLESGYAFVARRDGTRISSVEELEEGERVRASLRDGSFTAVVEDIEPKEKNG